jgi:signal transduction histidine kinase
MRRVKVTTKERLFLRSISEVLIWIGCLWVAFQLPAEGGRLLTRVAEVRELTREAAELELPVRLEGMVILATPSGFFIHDGDDSIWVQRATVAQKSLWLEPPPKDFGPGAVVQLQGKAVAGGYAPSIRPSSLRFLRKGKLPEPGRPSMELLVSGSEDCRWIELEGVVQEAVSSAYSPQCLLTLATGGHSCLLAVQNAADIRQEDLVDARVRVRGVFSARPNLRGQMAGLQLFVSDLRSFEILKSPPVDPFLSPRVALRDLLPFRADTQPGHRKVTRGVVSFVYPGRFFFIQEGNTGIRVDSVNAEARPGTEIEVAGFVTQKHPLAGLGGAVIRATGRESSIEVRTVTSKELMNPPPLRSWSGIAREDWNGRRIRMTGRLLKAETAPGSTEISLVIESGGTVFTALLPSTPPVTMPSAWVEGAEVSLVGTCELELQPVPIEQKPVVTTISGFRLWLSSPDQVRILRTPSWWTTRRLWAALGGVCVALALTFGWNGLLRREVARRGIRLAGEISERREAELEFKTTLRERERLAHDLHDTLEQALTGLSLQLQAAELFQADEPARSAEHLRLAQQFLDRSREDVHRTVWDLRARGLDGGGLVEALRERAETLVSEQGVTIEVAGIGDSRFLPDFIAGNLFLLALEGITNALKHAAAKRIEVILEFTPDGVRQRITDDGCGFDPSLAPGHRDGHFGLQGMRERAKRIGGTLMITSRPGAGTRIEVFVPVGAMEKTVEASDRGRHHLAMTRSDN